MRLCLAAVVLLVMACDSRGGGSTAPSVEQFQTALESQLQTLKPEGYTERTVLFEKVTAGTAKGPRYSFAVTATIHDYGPGYPSNGYFGQSCVGRMSEWPFEMLPNAAGQWIVQGRMTVSDARCQDNPSEGTAAIAVASLAGTRAKPVVLPPAPPNAVVLGEYACYGTGSSLMAGMGFVLADDGSYQDLDQARGGSWQYDAGSAVIRFDGGFLDGQRGSGVSAEGFAISSTVS